MKKEVCPKLDGSLLNFFDGSVPHVNKLILNPRQVLDMRGIGSHPSILVISKIATFSDEEADFLNYT